MKISTTQNAETITAHKDRDQKITVRAPTRTSKKEAPLSAERKLALQEDLDKCSNSAEKMSIYNSATRQEKTYLAGYELMQAGGKKITKFAPADMFPPTVYGWEARYAYEEELNNTK